MDSINGQNGIQAKGSSQLISKIQIQHCNCNLAVESLLTRLWPHSYPFTPREIIKWPASFCLPRGQDIFVLSLLLIVLPHPWSFFSRLLRRFFRVLAFYTTLTTWAQLFKGRLALTQGWILIQLSLFLCSRAYLSWFSLFFVEYPVIISWTKRIKPNFSV